MPPFHDKQQNGRCRNRRATIHFSLGRPAYQLVPISRDKAGRLAPAPEVRSYGPFARLVAAFPNLPLTASEQPLTGLAIIRLDPPN